MSTLVPLAARRSHRVIVPSAATRDDVTRFIGIAPDRIDVVPQGVCPPRAEPVPEAELRGTLSLGSRPILLTASAKRPHKNLARLLDALASIEPHRRPVLVLPGYPTPYEAELRSRAVALGLNDDTRFLGWVRPDELEGLYACASAFVFPSLYEGFGLPVLEAMARGVPVACSDRGSLAEVAGDAALFFDPESTQAIARAILDLLYDHDPNARQRALGLERAARFTWASTARGTLATYARAAA